MQPKLLVAYAAHATPCVRVLLVSFHVEMNCADLAIMHSNALGILDRISCKSVEVFEQHEHGQAPRGPLAEVNAADLGLQSWCVEAGAG